MNAFARFFTPERRQLIQAFLITLAPLAIMFGCGTDGTWEQALIISGAVLGAVASLLSLVNVRVATGRLRAGRSSAVPSTRSAPSSRPLSCCSASTTRP